MITALAHGGHEHTETLVATAPAIAGLLAGTVHVLIGPDHLAAVTPLAIDRNKRHWTAGCLWGLGHSTGVWTLALLAILFRESLPLETVSGWSETLVGITLIAIGLWGIHRVARLHVHSHTHSHTDAEGNTHTHRHTHAHARPHEPTGDHNHTPEHRNHTHSLLGIGALHGFAGTAHLLAVLPALAMPDRTTAVAYVISFGVGSILGMGLFTAGLGMLLRATTDSARNLPKLLLSTTSLAAVAIGIAWLVPSTT